MPATWDDAFVDFTAEARASLPTEFCQRHLGGYVGPNPLTPDERARMLAAVVARERSDTEALIRLYETYPLLPVRAREVTAAQRTIADQQTRITELLALNAELERQRNNAEMEAIDLAHKLADAESKLSAQATMKIVGHWTKPKAIPIAEGPAPMPATALRHSV